MMDYFIVPALEILEIPSFNGTLEEAFIALSSRSTFLLRSLTLNDSHNRGPDQLEKILHHTPHLLSLYVHGLWGLHPTTIAAIACYDLVPQLQTLFMESPHTDKDNAWLAIVDSRRPRRRDVDAHSWPSGPSPSIPGSFLKDVEIILLPSYNRRKPTIPDVWKEEGLNLTMRVSCMSSIYYDPWTLIV